MIFKCVNPENSLAQNECGSKLAQNETSNIENFANLESKFKSQKNLEKQPTIFFTNFCPSLSRSGLMKKNIYYSIN